MSDDSAEAIDVQAASSAEGMAATQKAPAPAPVYPIHHIPGLKKKRSPAGNKVLMDKMAEELAAKAVVDQDRRSYVDQHPLVRGHNPSPTGNSAIDTLNHIKHRLAREAATMEFNRSRLDANGADTSAASARIIAAWKNVAQIELDIKKQGVTVLDPNSEEMQRIFKMWIETLQTIFSTMVKEGVVGPEVMDLFFNKFSAAMEGWEGRLE